MNPRIRFIALTATLLASGAAVYFGKLEREVSFDAVLELWADVLHDADKSVVQVVRVSAGEEMALGRSLAATYSGATAEDAAETAYVTAVAHRLLTALHRKNIDYHFHVLDSPEVNAFALPGGQIYVMRGLLDFVTSEAELAAVLAHEMSHVDLGHCVERYQYEVTLNRIGAADLGKAADLARRFATVPYNQFQETEADAEGLRLLIEARYNPEAAPRLFQRFAAGETAPSGDPVSAYFRSHPPSQERTARLAETLRKEQRAIAGQKFYEGRMNLRTRTPLEQQNLAEEWK